MNREAVRAWLDGTSPLLAGRTPTLAFDTNAIFGDKGGVELLDTVNRANASRVGAPEIRLVLSSVVWCEKVHQMAERRGERFDPSLPLEFVRSKNVTIEAFDAEHALTVARRLAARFPSRAAWAQAKRGLYLRALGLSDDASERDGTACSATLDWLVIGHAEAMGYLLVSDDRGAEFEDVTHRCTFTDALAAARDLLHARTAH